MTTRIRLWGDTDVNGMWLKTYDPNANDGRGHIDLTTKESEGMAFDDQVAALEFWRQQSTVRPLRPDGKPNRPLTAFNVEFING